MYIDKQKSYNLIDLIIFTVILYGDFIDDFDDIVIFTEFETNIIITNEDIKRLMLKNKLNENTIRDKLLNESRIIADIICSIFDTKKWIGR